MYIPKKDVELARQLAQKSYNEKVLRYSENMYTRIAGMLKEYEDEKIEKIFLDEHPERQKLISPVEEIFQQKLDKWISQPYTSRGFNEDAPVIRTNSGLRVRSKSEKTALSKTIWDNLSGFYIFIKKNRKRDILGT